MLYIVKLSFRSKENIKTFSSEGKLREFVASRSTLKGWLKEAPATKRKLYQKKVGRFIKEIRTEWVKIEVNVMDYSSPHRFL